ncbi:probable LRR receptor-like serine/threonine-protein kinase At3g47570 isoform X2 [Nicotiana sylvestris]
MISSLYLGRNDLEGEIPEEIGYLRNLEILDVQNCSLSGPLPFSISNITSLRLLNLYGNKLSGSLPPDMCLNMPDLRAFDLGNNQFSGTIPKEFGNCTSLSDLFLRENNLIGELPMEIGNLFNLGRLDLHYNFLTGPIPSTIFNMSNIRGISFLGNFFTGSLPADIGLGLPNLEELYLGYNNLTGSIPNSLSNASNIFRLGIGYNNFSGPFPRSFGNLKRLEYLNVNDNHFTREPSSPELTFFDSLTNCRHLRQLWIGYNPLDGNLPASVGNLSSSLDYVYAAYSEIRGSMPREIGYLSGLSFLFLQGNYLSGFIPSSIGNLENLQALNLYGNKMISGPIPEELCNLKNLGFLSLGNNEICCSIPACLGNIKSLRYVYLDSNKLIFSIPPSLWNLNDLLHLDVSSNFLESSLPPEIGNLKVATLLNVSKNQISGIIPSTIGAMQNMAELSFAENRLEGPIPESLGNMVALESLDLSHNKLSGGIPKSLVGLSHLNYLNVSYNRLSGEIPTGGPFANFSYDSFLSNEGLCGAARLQTPACRSNSPHRKRKKNVLLIVLISLMAASIIMLSVTLTIFLVIRCRKRKTIIATHQADSSPATLHGRVSYHDLQQATNGFSTSNLLGSGSYGSVYKATFGSTILAVKVFNLQTEGAFKSFDTECEVLRNVRHRNLAKVINSCSNVDFKALVLEYMPNGNLDDWLHSESCSLDIMQRVDIMIDVGSALDYLHHDYFVPVVHCDLKPSNVLLDEDMVAHVSDFGLAKLLGVGESIAQTKTLATIGYIAPEFGLEGLVSTRCDIYSYGIMLMEMFTRKKPTDEQFAENSSLRGWIRQSWPHAMDKIIDPELMIPEEKNKTGKMQCLSSIMELALRCTTDMPEERMNIKHVLAQLKTLRTMLENVVMH